MPDHERIHNQIEALENKHIIGCAIQWLMLLLIGTFTLAFLLKHTHDKAIRVAIAFGFTGLLLGFATSFLTCTSRKLLMSVFTFIPLALSLGMFIFRTLFDCADKFPLKLVITPLFITAGFLLGQLRTRRTIY